MGTFFIRKGRNIPLKGAARQEIVTSPFPKHVAVQPSDFKGLSPRLSVKVDDTVKVGTAIFSDKAIPEIQVASPASGKVIAINRGAKRALLSIVIETDGRQDTESFQKFSEDQIKSISKADITDVLLKGRLWPVIRQRPFSKVADPHKKPKSIFIHAMNTEPLAAESRLVMLNQKEALQAGILVLRSLTPGKVYLSLAPGDHQNIEAFQNLSGVEAYEFSGPHPAGNTSVHIHSIAPLKKNDTVHLFDGKGGEASGILVNLTSRKADIQIRTFKNIQMKEPQIILACALPKKSK